MAFHKAILSSHSMRWHNEEVCLIDPLKMALGTEVIVDTSCYSFINLIDIETNMRHVGVPHILGMWNEGIGYLPTLCLDIHEDPIWEAP